MKSAGEAFPGNARSNESPPSRMRWDYTAVALASILVPFAGTVYAVTLFLREGISSLDLLMMIALYYWTVLGIELGYHRYMTHRTFQLASPVKKIVIIAGAMSADGPPIWWAALHRRHHAFTDSEGDPHSPHTEGNRLSGLWNAHLGWMLKPDHTDPRSHTYAPDLVCDREFLWLDRLFGVWVAWGLVLPALVGGLATGSWHGAWTGFVWGGLVRMFLGQHILWFGILTGCHAFGWRPFDTPDRSTNNPLISILYLGAGWHNNHHAFPSSARAGLRWWEYDPSWWMIRLLAILGLAWDIKEPGPDQVRLQLEK